MSSRVRTIAVGFSLAAFSTPVFSGPSFAAKQANEICFDSHLTQSEKDLCKQQIAAAQTKDEQKKLQAKFKARVDERSGGEHKK